VDIANHTIVAPKPQRLMRIAVDSTFARYLGAHARDPCIEAIADHFPRSRNERDAGA
jgi:hypothetical protein